MQKRKHCTNSQQKRPLPYNHKLKHYITKCRNNKVTTKAPWTVYLLSACTHTHTYTHTHTHIHTHTHTHTHTHACTHTRTYTHTHTHTHTRKPTQAFCLQRRLPAMKTRVMTTKAARWTLGVIVVVVSNYVPATVVTFTVNSVMVDTHSTPRPNPCSLSLISRQALKHQTDISSAASHER